MRDVVTDPIEAGLGSAPGGAPQRVVIVGAGFAGLEAARALDRAPVQVTVLDRRNHHLFQPLLYQVATAALSPAEVAWPVRHLLARQKNADVAMAEVEEVDLARREVRGQGRVWRYDALVVATGSTHAYFGHEDWAPFAPGLKTLDDALRLRRRVLSAFEDAELATSAAERTRLLTFVVVGGGPTGVEMAGAIAELARDALPREFHHIDTRQARVLLVEAGPRILGALDESLSVYAAKALARLGVEVRTGAAVTACDAQGVVVGAERIGAATVVWAAGVATSALVRGLPVEHDRAGRAKVTPYLTIPAYPDVFVLGDAAAVTDAGGAAVPGLAPAAKQQGRHAGRLIAARLGAGPDPGPFRYRHAGNLATIGRSSAAVQLGGLKLTGWIGWVFWSVAHVYFLIGVRNRVAVALDWLWSWFSRERAARLITDG